MELLISCAKAFLCGGILCLIGQILIDKTSLTPAKILVTYVVSGVILGGLGIYQKLADFGGAGASVPLTGFGFLLSTPFDLQCLMVPGGSIVVFL